MTGVKMIDLLLGLSPQLQEVVLSGCSAPDLIRLSCAARVVQKVSIDMLKRRRLNLTMDTTYSEHTRPEDDHRFIYRHLDTQCTIVDVWGPTITMDAPTMVEDVIDKKLLGFGQMIQTLIKHGIVRKLEFTGYPSQFDSVLAKLDKSAKALRVDCLVFTSGSYKDWDDAEDHQLFLLKHITPRRLVLGCWNLDEEFDFAGRDRQLSSDTCHGAFLLRGLRDAKDVEFVDCRESGHTLGSLLHIITAPAINLGVQSAVLDRVLIDVIEQWSCDSRAVTLFCCCVELTAKEGPKPAKALDGIRSRIRKELDESSEIAWPATIPRTIVDHFNKAEEHYENGFLLAGRAIVVGRAVDELKLCVLLKTEVMEDGITAVGVFSL